MVGESVPQRVADKWASAKQLYNMYGPTEGTCGASIKQLFPGKAVTIGTPNPTTRIYILNERQSLTPIGMVGEIYLAGIQIAKGYLDLPVETENRFLPDAVLHNGEQMYRTGDRGYWIEYGEIICLGRRDRQIKLRGFRLDMNDLEIRVMKAIPALEAVAIAPRGEQLCALVQPASVNIEDVRRRISEILPSHAIPQRIQAVEKFPTTAAGKIDYAAVGRIKFEAAQTLIGALRTSKEKAVASAFRTILELEKDVAVNADSHFIELGGHSLRQLALKVQLGVLFNCQFPLRAIIECPTVRGLANSIDNHIKGESKPLSVISHCQEQLSPIEKD